MVNGYDIYNLDDLEKSGFGSVSIDKTRRILSSFTQYDIIADQNFTKDDVTDISDKYLLDTEDAILPIPLTTGLMRYPHSPYRLLQMMVQMKSQTHLIIPGMISQLIIHTR